MMGEGLRHATCSTMQGIKVLLSFVASIYASWCCVVVISSEAKMQGEWCMVAWNLAVNILLCKTGEVFGPFGFTAKALFIVMKLYCQQIA